MIPIGQMLSNGLGFLKELMGFKREQAARQNSPEMQGNKKAATDAKTVDEARRDVAEGDTEAIRKGLS